MINVYGEGRGFRVVWLLEEMGLPYQLRPVDLIAGVDDDEEFLAVNPSGFIPAIQDGEITMFESIAIMEYVMARYGPTPLAPNPQDAAYPFYQKFLHLGEAGLMGFLFMVFADNILAPENQRRSWTGNFARELFESRRKLVAEQLERSPYLAGRAFSAADISVTYALEFAERAVGLQLSTAEQSFLKLTTGRPAYARAMDACKATKAWVATLSKN